jgi:TRAP-type C4-dicarboxylate transport system permease small subunit
MSGDSAQHVGRWPVMLGRARRWTERVSDWISAPAELCVLLMMVHMLADIASRAVLGAGLEGTVEAVTHLYMVGAAILPLAALEARSQHLHVEALVERVGPTTAKGLASFAKLITALVCAAMAWLTLEQALEATAIREHVELTRWSLPTWPARWVFPLAFGMMCIAALVNLVAAMRAVPPAQK